MSTQYDKTENPWGNVPTSLEDGHLILQRGISGESLSDVLNHLLVAIETQAGDESRTSVALLDDAETGLMVVASRHLPQDYLAPTQHLALEHDTTPWIACARSKETVYVEDIQAHDTHPEWVPWRQLASSHGLRSCWSTPIQTADGKLLGVLSNYGLHVQLPTDRDIERIGLVVRIVAFMIEQHCTEHALHRSAEHWRRTVDGMQEGFLLAEGLRDAAGRVVDFRVLEVNPAFEHQSGMKAGKMLREMAASVPAEVMETFIHVLESGEGAQREFFTASPSPAWYEARVRRDGPDRLMALFLDVTARKQAQAELWEGQLHKNFLLVLGDHLRKLDDAVAIEYAACEGIGKHMKLDCVAILKLPQEGQGAANVTVRWPATATRLFDVDGGKTLESLIRKGNSAYLSAFIAHANSKERAILMVVPLARWGHAGSALLAWPAPFDGAHRMSQSTALSLIEEVAERMCAAVERCEYAHMLELRTESAVAERDRIWRLSPELLAEVDGNGRFVSINPAVYNILGWQPKEFLGMQFDTLIHSEDLDCAQAELQRIRSSGEGTRHYLESRVRKHDGTYRWINWSLSWSQGHLYLAGRDETDLKVQAEMLYETEKALRQSQKIEAVGRLTGGIAHDFNNMLQGITGALYVIQRKMARGELDEIPRFISVAKDSANRAARLTERLLTFSRKQPIDPVPFDVNQTVRSLSELFQRYTGESVELVFDINPDVWTVRCDKNQFENVVLNLVINACDAMPRGGLVTVSASNRVLDRNDLRAGVDIVPGEFVEVCVEDVGCGMTPDVMAHAFDPFFTTKPQGEGTGLGLSMIYGFTRQAGGLVTLDSKVDAGTAVRIFLPRHAGAPLPDGPAMQDVTSGESGLTGVVALVEDDANVREMVRESLEELGLSVVTANDGDEGLSVVAGEIDLLVTDIGLPGINGRQLADVAQRYHPDLPVLFMTGYAEGAATDPEFLSDGMELIVKPFSLDLLAQKVAIMLKDGRSTPRS